MIYKIMANNLKYEEMEVQGKSGETLIMTDPKRVNAGDFHSITRYVVDCLDNIPDIPEFLYRICYMPDAYTLRSFVVGEEEVSLIMRLAQKEILHCDSVGVSRIIQRNKEAIAELTH